MEKWKPLTGYNDVASSYHWPCIKCCCICREIIVCFVLPWNIQQLYWLMLLPLADSSFICSVASALPPMIEVVSCGVCM